MWESWNSIIEFCSPFWEDMKGPFLGASTLALILYFKNKLLNFMGRLSNLLSSIRNRRFVLPKSLENYKTSLDEETLRLNHSWKLEGQTLKDLLVPVNVEERGKTNRLPLEQHLKSKYEQWKNARFVLLGDAGSGKSVAMGVIARSIWNIELSSPLVPVLLTFSDIKMVQTKEELEKVITQSLERHQFEEGKQTNQAEKFIQENLYQGNVLLLLDGFDELEKSNRFFQTYPQIPFVLSSRIAVWKQIPNPFPSLSFETIEMADLTPYEIRLFVHQWQFAGNKSGQKSSTTKSI